MPNTVTYDDLTVSYDSLVVTYDGEVVARTGTADARGRPRLAAVTAKTSSTTVTLRAGGRGASTGVKQGQSTAIVRAGGRVAAISAHAGQGTTTLRARSRGASSVQAFATSGAAVFHVRASSSSLVTRTGTAVAVVRASARAVLLAGKTTSWPMVVHGAGRLAAPGLHASSTLLVVHAGSRLAETSIRSAVAVVVLRARSLGALVAEALQLQIAAPIGDLADGSWTNELGSATDLYASIDEGTASDADYIQSSLSPGVVDECRLILAALEDPGASSHHTLRYRYQKSETDGDRIDLTVRLYAADGSTVIAEQTHTDIDAVTDAELLLSAAEAGAIPSADYAGLVIGFRAVKV